MSSEGEEHTDTEELLQSSGDEAPVNDDGDTSGSETSSSDDDSSEESEPEPMMEEDSEPEPMMEKDLVNQNSDSAMFSGEDPMVSGSVEDALLPMGMSPRASTPRAPHTAC